MIVDAHGHLWKQVEGAIGGKTPVRPLRDGKICVGQQTVLGMPPYMADCAARAEYYVAEMDAAGVDLAVIVQEYLDGPQNDYCLETVGRYPDRFFVHGLPDFFQPDRAADEAMSLFSRGFRGLKFSAMHLTEAVALDDARLTPIFRHMEKHGLVVAVDLAVSESQTRQMRNMLEDCPQLRMAIGHFGMVTRGGWPAQLELCRYPNVYLETGGIVWLFRDEGYPFPGAVQAIRQAADQVGIEKLMWGSDWPRTMVDFTYRQSLDFVRRGAAFSLEEKQKLLGENAARLYGVAAPREPREPLPLITEG